MAHGFSDHRFHAKPWPVASAIDKISARLPALIGGAAVLGGLGYLLVRAPVGTLPVDGPEPAASAPDAGRDPAERWL